MAAGRGLSPTTTGPQGSKAPWAARVQTHLHPPCKHSCRPTLISLKPSKSMSHKVGPQKSHLHAWHTAHVSDIS